MTGPSKSPDGWQRLWEVFHAALDRNVPERAAFLDAACGEDAVFRRNVDELLAAHGSDGILDRPVTADPPPRPALAAGDVLAARFRIVRLIGSGGMGTVYEARDEELGTSIAVKTLHPEMAQNTEALERFRRELLLARRVTHPNACRLFDLVHHHDAAGPVAFLTMELLRGETLAERLARTGPLGEHDAYLVVEQIASALAAAHRAGVVHRDLKSANVVLVAADDGEPATRAVVTDFGLAALTAGVAPSGAGLTRSGQLLGTPAFMAPEQLEGGVLTPATDIYALGLVMYEMVTGAVPFAGESPLTAAIKRLREPPPSPRLRRPGLGAEWNAAIMRCLEREPMDRFGTADAVVSALRPGPLSARFFLPRRLRRRAIALALAGATAAAVVGAVVTWRPGADRNAAPAALAFNERDWVLVADFDNQTGDAVLDDTIRFALERELTASQFVNVVPRERVADALRLMKRAGDTSVSAEVAREVAMRDGGIRALVRGRIDKLGDTYVAAVELVEPANGIVVTSFAEEARKRDDILAAVRRLSNRLRAAVGEELSRVQQTNPRLVQVTTPSLRALQLYSRADAIIARGDGDGAAEQLLRQAIEEDPEFASAYIHLAHAIQGQNGPRNDALRYATRAMELAATAGEGERQFIRGSYYSMAGDYPNALASYQALLQLYPNHFWGTINAGMILSYALLRGEDAVPYFLRAAGLRPNEFMFNRNAAWNIAVRGNNLVEARQPIARARSLLTPELARRRGPPAGWVEVFPVYDRGLNGDVHGALNDLQQLERVLDAHPDRGALGYQIMLAYQLIGRLRDSTRVAAPAALSAGDLVFGFLRDDRTVAARWASVGRASLPPGLGVVGPILLARIGLRDAARSALARVDFVDLPLVSRIFPQAFTGAASIVRGELALADGKTEEGIALIQQGLPAERLTGSSVYFLGCESLASAWLKQGRPDRAIQVLEEAVRQKNRTVQGSGAFWLRVVWKLAQRYRQTGREGEALKHEAELRRLLAVADADHPIVVEMRRAGVGTPAP